MLCRAWCTNKRSSSCLLCPQTGRITLLRLTKGCDECRQHVVEAAAVAAASSACCLLLECPAFLSASPGVCSTMGCLLLGCCQHDILNLPCHIAQSTMAKACSLCSVTNYLLSTTRCHTSAPHAALLWAVAVAKACQLLCA